MDETIFYDRREVCESGGFSPRSHARVSAGDKAFFASIAARQKLIAQDLADFEAAYPDIVGKDTVGALYASALYLRDLANSLAR